MNRYLIQFAFIMLTFTLLYLFFSIFMTFRTSKQGIQIYLCQECYKNSALFAQFLFSFLTYVLLSYFVRLHCANIHTPLPLLSYFCDFQNIKTRYSDLFGAVLGKGHL